jgi:2-polyprenyl-6-hydroxyphenyl methylase/3-demethylubiquinone-9 3-methyltransferase
MSFTFGQNWLQFSESLDEARLQDAEASLLHLVGEDGLRGRSFLDIGAGSGLFSIAAARLGAGTIVAIDRDEHCLWAARHNVKRFLTAEQAAAIDIVRGDILNTGSLPASDADVVYAWGSLHHTGSMWQAIENAAGCCRAGGYFVLAIYNRTKLSPFWLRAKRVYSAAPRPVEMAMAAALCAPRIIVRLLKGSHPFRTDRGMSVWFDAIDWLGGLPYEYATAAEVTAFIERLGFSRVRANLTTRSGCNEFTFVKNSSRVNAA